MTSRLHCREPVPPSKAAIDCSEEEKLEQLVRQIEKAFSEPDPYFLAIWQSRFMKAKWERAAVLQSGYGWKRKETDDEKLLRVRASQDQEIR